MPRIVLIIIAALVLLSLTITSTPVPTEEPTEVTYTLTVNIREDGSGSVIKSPDQNSYTNGTIVTLTASPAKDWEFSHWFGDLTSVQNPVQITLNSNKSVTADFTFVEEAPPPETYALTITKDGSGTVTKNPSQSSYEKGTVITLTASPARDWEFSNWSGDLTGSTNPAQIIMNSSKTVMATFTEIPISTYTLTINISGYGSVAKSPNQTTYPYGTVVTLAAMPSADYTFTGWSDDLSGSTNPTTITMNSNKSVTAIFIKLHALNIYVEGGGTTNPVPGVHYYPAGEIVTIGAIPDSGWLFDHWNNTCDTENPKVVTIPSYGDLWITANFVSLPPPYLKDWQIIFVSSIRSEKDDLWVMNGDSTGQQVLLPNIGWLDIIEPKWSPDGELICYKDHEAKNLVILNRSGEIVHTIERPSDNDWGITDFSWAPDGTSIIYSIKYEGIYEFRIQDKQTRTIIDTVGFTYDHCPVWSLDGKSLAFVHHEFGSIFYVCMIDFDPEKLPYAGEDRHNERFNPEIKLLHSGSNTTYDENIHLEWTSGGEKLVFYSLAEEGAIYISNIDSQSTFELKLEEFDLAMDYWWRTDPVAVSPDGQTIAFSVTGGELYAINIDGSALRKLADSSSTAYPAWSPDSKYVVFQDLGRVCLVDRDGEEFYKFPGIEAAGSLSFFDWCAVPYSR